MNANGTDGRLWITVTCHTCDWTARIERSTGDDDIKEDDIESARFLRRALLEHVRLSHADQWKRG